MAPRTRVLLLAAVAMMLLCCASAGRHESFKDMVADRLGRGKKSKMTVLVVKYVVPPTLHNKFTDMWLNYEKTLRDAGGLKFYELTKNRYDNTDFCAYTEWDTFEDLMDHLDASGHVEFMDFLDDNDITREAFPLETVGDIKREYRFDREGEKAAAASRRAFDEMKRRKKRGAGIIEVDPRDIPTHVTIKFNVPPSMHKQFEDVFMDCQERTVKDEDENRYYTLRKFATINHEYIIRAGWDTLDAWYDHLTSKHFSELRGFTTEENVEWFANPFVVLASSEEMY